MTRHLPIVFAAFSIFLVSLFAYGLSIGYQRLLDDEARRQLIVELGGRKETRGDSEGAAGLAVRYQKALGKQTVMQLDAFTALQERESLSYGTRIEFRFSF